MMKIISQKNGFYFFCILVIALYLFSVYFYPRSRDEFYYFSDEVNIFEEYYNSYFEVNARIGQYFSNFAGRHLLFKLLLSVFLFLIFFYIFYLFVFKTYFTKISTENVKKLVVISGLFIFLIGYFGEMFFYIPYSSNYTLINVFYLIYIYSFTQYFLYKKNCFAEKKISIYLIVLFGVFIGMGNEHIPPALLLLSGIYFLHRMIKFQKFTLPAKEICFAFGSLLVGYILLFFAPANKVRMQREGKSELGFNILEYWENVKNIGKLYYYYNIELLLFIAVVIIYFLVYTRKKMKKIELKEIGSYIFLSIIAIFIAAYSPIVGTRLLFFSNVLFIVVGLIILLRNSTEYFDSKKIFNYAVILSMAFLSFYFSSAAVITYNANKNYEEVMNSIKIKAKSSAHVVIEQSFDYRSQLFGNFNRKVLLDTGELYIDKDEKQNNSVESNIIKFYEIRTLKTKN